MLLENDWQNVGRAALRQRLKNLNPSIDLTRSLAHSGPPAADPLRISNEHGTLLIWVDI
jgi:hypothetical protein